MRSLRSAIVGAAAVLVSATAAAGPLKLLPDDTRIVVPAAAHGEERNAANFLQEWMRKAYRVQKGFDIVGEDKTADAGGRTLIAVGKTRWATDPRLEKLQRDGFIIRRQAESVVIAGGSPKGTVCGAAHFLDRFCGVRIYMPNELFFRLPDKGEILLPDDIDVMEEPFVRNCMMTGSNYIAEEGLWFRANSAFRKESFNHQHSMYERFPPEQYAGTYPEIYPILKGKRYLPQSAKDQGWQPCLSEPRLVDAAAESAAAYFKDRPDVRYISFSVMDSHSHCECDRCMAAVKEWLAKDPREGKSWAYSLMNAVFLNNLAQRLKRDYPDKLIVYIAYSQVRQPPPFKLHGNIVPVVVFTIADTLIDRVLEPPGNNLIDRWAKVSSNFGHHDWGEGMGYMIPRSYIGLTSKVARYVKEKGLTWHYAHFEAYANWGLDGPKLYITPRIWWNPDVDVEKLWDQLCDDLFPASRDAMREYFATLEKLWIAMDDQCERKLFKWSNQFLLGTPEQQALMRKCRELLDRAAQTAADDREKQRVRLFSKTFRVSEYLCEFANAEEVEKARMDEARRYVEEHIAGDPLTLFGARDKARVRATFEQALTVSTKGKPVR